MKLIKLLTILSIVTIESYSQNNNAMKVPEINKEFEKLDISIFSEHPVAGINQKINEESGTTFKLFNGRKYEEWDQKSKRTIRSFYASGEREIKRITGYDYSVNPIVGIYKEFYPDGKIRVKGLYCWFGFKIGTWFYFDQDGVVAKEEDTDVGFSFTYKDVFEYCKENNVSLERNSEFKPHITKSKTSDVPTTYWYITFPFTDKMITHKLSGVDGTVISISEEKLNNADQRMGNEL